MPDSVLMPAPVKTTISLDARIFAANCSNLSIIYLIERRADE
jgi:hypothetical protein